jgi:hypothetical protein
MNASAIDSWKPSRYCESERSTDGGLAAGLEAGTLLERQHDAREGLVEFRRRHRAPSARRIVEVHAPVAEPLEHDEVVEVHEHDRRQRHLGEVRRFLLEAARDDSMGARRAQQPARLAAVAAHAALDAHLLERHVAAVIREHHGERRGAALHRFELKDRRRAVQRRVGGVQRASINHVAKAATAARSTASARRRPRG